MSFVENGKMPIFQQYRQDLIYKLKSKFNEKILIIAVIATLLYSCKSVKYIPVQTTKIEYRDNFVRDSIFRYDLFLSKIKATR